MIDQIRNALYNGKVIWQKHALQRMMERDIARDEVKQAILTGVVIENYSNDMPFPSLLIAMVDGVPLHVVVAYDEMNRTVYIITVYRPDERYFEEDLITRRKS